MGRHVGRLSTRPRHASLPEGADSEITGRGASPEGKEASGQSLGFAMKFTPYGLLYGHTGNNGDFQAYSHFYIDKNHGIVLFINSDNLFSSEFAQRLSEFLDE